MINCNNFNNLSSNERYFTNPNSNFLIENCFFQRINNYLNGYGGVIYCKDQIISMKIKDSIFFNCSSSSAGGAIYFYCPSHNSNSELIRTCGYKCYTTSSEPYQFGHIVTKSNSILNYNNGIFLSISKCSNHEIPTSWHTINFYYSNISLNNFNSSYNRVKRISGFYISYPSKFTSSFNTIFNNFNIESVCIWFHSYSNENILSYSNIINNNSPQ